MNDLLTLADIMVLTGFSHDWVKKKMRSIEPVKVAGRSKLYSAAQVDAVFGRRSRTKN